MLFVLLFVFLFHALNVVLFLLVSGVGCNLCLWHSLEFCINFLESVYQPQSNAKVERFHRAVHDVLSKKAADSQQTWDLFLNPALAVIRSSVSHQTFHHFSYRMIDILYCIAN